MARFNTGGYFLLGTTTNSAKLYVGNSLPPTTNIQVRIDSSNVALVTSGGTVGFGTLTPSANLHVMGNLYVSNALTTTNVYAASETLTGTTGQTTSFITGNVYVSNALTTMNLFATGNTSSISNMVIQNFDFVVAATAGSYSNVCSITDVPNGSAIYAIYVDMMARGAGGSAQTKTYIIVSNYNATAGVWTRALPIGNPTAGGQTGLDVMTLNGTTTLRVTNRNAAETVNIGIVVKVSSSSFSRVAITDLTSVAGSTGTGATQTGFYPTTLLTQVANRVGVSIEQPTANLHVGGNQIIAGLTGTPSLNITGNVFASNALVAPNIYGTTSIVGGTYYGIVAGANTIASSTQTLSGTAGVTSLNVTGNVFASNAFVAPTINATTALNVSGTFSLGALGGTIRNILCGTTGSQQITGNGPLLDYFNIGTTLAGTNYLVFMTPFYGSATHVLALQLDSRTTSRVNFQVARVDASSGTTTYTIQWMIIDLN